jgi:hypothetical protein
LLWLCLLRLLLPRWASLLPPEREQPSGLQQLLRELVPPPAACAEHLHDAKAEGEAEEEAEEAEEAEAAETAEEVEAAEAAEEAEVMGRVASAEVLAGAAAGDAAGSEGGCAHARASVPAVKPVTDEGEEDEAALHSRITSLFEQLLVVH